MERLYLSLNRIREIPDEIGYCQRLVELDFSSNLLEAIPVGLAMCINLNLLNLGMNCKLSCVLSSFLSVISYQQDFRYSPRYFHSLVTIERTPTLQKQTNSSPSWDWQLEMYVVVLNISSFIFQRFVASLCPVTISKVFQMRLVPAHLWENYMWIIMQNSPWYRAVLDISGLFPLNFALFLLDSCKNYPVENALHWNNYLTQHKIWHHSEN
jgi:hypothetical protein